MTEEVNWQEIAEYYFDKPVEFVEDIIEVEPTDQQKKVLIALEEDDFVAVKSGHGVGKTAVESWAILWFMFTRPGCRVPCTAPTSNQLNNILWPEVKKWYNNSKLKPYELFEWQKTAFRINHLDYKDTWFAVPRSTNKPDNLQGFHEGEVLFVIDEASGIPPGIMEVIEGALTNKNAKLLMCGNPTQLSGMFFDAFHKDSGFYKCLTFSCEDSSRVSEKYCTRIAEKYGKDSNVYRVRVKGEFPTQEEDTIIPISLLSKAVNTDIEKSNNIIHIGCDPARYGDDETSFYIREGNKIIDYKSKKKNDTMWVANCLHNYYKKYKHKEKIRIKIDVTGIGAGVVDRMREKNLEKAEIIEVANNQKPKSDKYYNAFTEMYYEFRDKLKSENVDLPDDEELIDQLAGRKYTFDNHGRFRAEPKDSFKKRTGRSPDRADALLLCFYEKEKISWDVW